MPPIADHPLRYDLANELHARPFPALSVPCTAVYLAIKQAEDAAGRDRQADLDHLIALLDRHGAAHPQPGATHYSGRIGRHRLKWESHTEFVTYTAFSDALSARAFDPADFEVFPADWLDQAPGARVSSVLLRVEPWPEKEQVIQHLNDWFVPESLAVSRVLDDVAVMAGDFRLDPAGHMRFAVFAAPDAGTRRIGRVVQRLCEIETYKSLSMLGFARARQMSARMGALDGELTGLMDRMSDDSTAAEGTLTGLLSTSAELERMVARNSFRFGATAAYEAIVHQRIEVMREQRFDGRQTFNEFMMRRYDPAMRTVKATERRLATMADRAIRAGELLRTRVDVERSAQNQKLLESMDQRADMQLKLQKTVEGLSVVAISYYAVSLVSYVAYPLAGLVGLSKGELTALVTLPVVAVVWASIRRIHRKMH
ncbi:DUF3422 family protein [Thalassovita taeanensis]|uniref:Uncharacterized membrane-anchored protein n=1 Tax=Thalassovita taeanensis TaxID=657014 RepID=A0A1H9FK99_9RHOB|nr:DUF3422 domain-containing protein [Thalassovita taeanensis]SEQ38381.1 Uncharacterized membrane-anchored protein [Thalassovita taeanensis]